MRKIKPFRPTRPRDCRQLLDNLRDLEKKGRAIAEQMQNEGIDILHECFEDEFDYA